MLFLCVSLVCLWPVDPSEIVDSSTYLHIWIIYQICCFLTENKIIMGLTPKNGKYAFIAVLAPR